MNIPNTMNNCSGEKIDESLTRFLHRNRRMTAWCVTLFDLTESKFQRKERAIACSI